MANYCTHIPDLEEVCLLRVLAACGDRLNAAVDVLSHPTYNLLQQDKLEDVLETARADFAIAIAALREYREQRSSGPVTEKDSK